MRLKGSMTVEAAYIFPFFTVLVASIITMDFKIYDSMLSDVCKIIGGMRYYESETFYYDNESKGIEYQSIICSPVLSEDKVFMSRQKIKINQLVAKFYNKNRLGSQESISGTDISSVITAGDNAGIVRAGGKVMEIIGG